MVDVSVIIVYRNQWELLNPCLRTVCDGARKTRYEIILVDNGSTDAIHEKIRQSYPEARLIRNHENLGHSVACNQGLAIAEGRYSVLLDCDTEIFPGALDLLVEFLDEHPAAGAAGPKLLNSDLTDQGAAKAFPNPLTALFGRNSLITRLFPNNRFSRNHLIGLHKKSDEPFQVDSTSSACLIVRREILEQVGGLDEEFFAYWNDVDWCRRIKGAGWQIWVVPQARVLHLEGQKRRTAQQQRWVIIQFHKSVYRYYCKHHAKFPLHPMRGVALVGLTLRAGLLIAANLIKQGVADKHTCLL
jgi:GT2 family glycosyltransferase